MAIRFLTGQRLTADLLNANIADYMPTTYTKEAALSRVSTTTLADDDELSGIPLSVGTWEIEVVGFFYTSVAATPGIKTQWSFTGSWNGSGAIRSCIGPGSDNTAITTGAATMHTRGNTIDATDAVYFANVSSAFTQFREISRNVVVTVAGNMALQWAQNVSSASPTVLAATSTVTVRKIEI